MGRKVKEEAVKSLIRIETSDILLIQETKMEGKDFLQVSKKFWKKGGGLTISARGASGGLGSLWNSSKYSLITETQNDHWLYLKLQLLDTKEVISLFNVYAPVNAGEKIPAGTPLGIWQKQRMWKTSSSPTILISPCFCQRSEEATMSGV